MRWLIAGPYPPSADPGAAAALAAVRRVLAAGDDATVVAPAPSAADDTTSLVGGRGLLALARRGRACDALWVRPGPGVLLATGLGRVRSLTERAALGRLLARFGTAVVDVGDLDLFPGGRAGAFVFGSGASFEVDDDEAARTLVARGAPAAAVRVRAPLPASGFLPTDDMPPPVEAARLARPAGPWQEPPTTADPAALEAWIVARAGSTRR